MKKIKSLFLLLAICFTPAIAQNDSIWTSLKSEVNFFMSNDLGRNGYYDQKPIAELMGNMAEKIGPECMVAAGDIHHFYGVESTSDPLWMTNYELIYSHPELMIPWYPILGNHEYRGNTQAVLDYTNVSRRWMMPARYYSKVLTSGETSVRIVFIDTTPLIDSYRQNSAIYPDACKQDDKSQLAWLDNTLKTAHEDWVIVIGHHPVFSDTNKPESERTDMQQKIRPILRRYHNVSFYACGHIHNFQHYHFTDDDIDYIVNSSASLSRPQVVAHEGTQFCSGEPGFSVISADKTHINWYMIDKEGKVIHTISKTK